MTGCMCCRALDSGFMNGVFHPKKIKDSLRKSAPTSKPTLPLPWRYLRAMVGRVVVLSAANSCLWCAPRSTWGLAWQSKAKRNTTHARQT